MDANAMAAPGVQYREFLRAGKFMLLRSKSSGRCFFYPRIAEPGTGATDLEWVPAGGSGVVYSATTARTRDESYNVSIIELDEGARLMSEVVGLAPDQVRIGLRVTAEIVLRNDEPLIVFRPL
jgi:uncharacterized OB-fold protein